jgi:hypothetical protein
MYNRFCFHLEANVGMHQEAKGMEDSSKASNQDEKRFNLVDQPQSSIRENQGAKKYKLSVCKK